MNKLTKYILATLVLLIVIVASAFLWVLLLPFPWQYIVSAIFGFIAGQVYSFILEEIKGGTL